MLGDAREANLENNGEAHEANLWLGQIYLGSLQDLTAFKRVFPESSPNLLLYL